MPGSTAFFSTLLQQSIFKDVPAALMAQLSPEMLRVYAKDEVIMREGEPAEALIIILGGHVDIVRAEVVLVRRGPNELIGEQGVVDDAPYSATAIAHEEVRALAIPADLAREFLREQHFTLNLIRILSGKLRAATQEQTTLVTTEESMFAAFRSHVHPRVLDDLLVKGLNAYGAPRYIDCAILFTDMRSYTSLSLEADPEDIVKELSRYLDAMIEIIHAHGGMIDKFIGDNVMAVWGFDQPGNDLAAKALDCALEMHATAARFSFRGHPIEIGTGLNYGTVFCGNVGNARKRQFTVLGQPVNLASRFEALSKVLNSPIVIGEDFYQKLPWSRRGLFKIHENVEVRGVGPMTCYALRREAGSHKIVRWGIIGCGDVTEKKSGPGFQKASNSALEMVMRRDAAKCEDYARRHGVAQWTTNASELIHNPRITAIAIATPPETHCHYALLAAAAKKPVIVEKPMARTFAECLEMLRAFEKAGVPLFVAYYRRCFAKFQHLRSIIVSGNLGAITRVQLCYRRKAHPIDPSNVPWRFVPEIAGGGLLMDLGSHGLNLVQFLLGDVAWQVEAKEVEWGMGPYQVEKRVRAFVSIGERIAGELFWDFDADRTEDWVIIHGERGELEFSVFEEAPYTITTRTSGREVHPFRAPEHVQLPFIQMVVNHLCYGTAVPCDASSAAATNLILDKILGKL
ncbi:Gfo/Idh/MocA family oxidoreductase [candidate division KSB1 bacterium]|nr:Gfo/Idh/MocA family oxidoreductase [candidate division KSB1 bacterium]